MRVLSAETGRLSEVAADIACFSATSPTTVQSHCRSKISIHHVFEFLDYIWYRIRGRFNKKLRPLTAIDLVGKIRRYISAGYCFILIIVRPDTLEIIF